MTPTANTSTSNRPLVGRAWRRRVHAVVRPLAVALVVLVVLYGTLLRLDALTLRYGPVPRPAWLHALQDWRMRHSALRPSTLTWDPVNTFPHRDGPPTHYSSDPYTYLQGAREMQSFYAANRREPLFPFVTKVYLSLLRQQDVAVSFAAASFSVLAIVLTFLLGFYSFSYWVGLGAALAIAIEYDMISWGIEGFRDDAFTCAVVLFTYAILRCWRTPSTRNAMLAGVAGGLACLVRITALTFVVPGLACLLLVSAHTWKARVKSMALGAAAMTLVAAPFVINCWIVFGDPLYPINVHADVYRAAEGQPVGDSQTASQYLLGAARTHPVRTFQTALLGMTTYPFEHKWQGFDVWIPSLGRWLSWAALVGVALFVSSPGGRVLLVVLAGSLVPYAFTWHVGSDFRFTEHAYPFFLIAACLTITGLISSPLRLRRLLQTGPGIRSALMRRPPLRTVLWCVFVVTLAATGSLLVTWTLPRLVVREALAEGEAVTIVAGNSDKWFFGDGWSRPTTGGNVTTRVADGGHATVRLPLPRQMDYDLTFRIDPFPRPAAQVIPTLPAMRILLNDRQVAAFNLRWNPARVGAYDVHVDRKLTRAGTNRLTLMASGAPGHQAACKYPPAEPGALSREPLKAA